MTEGISLLYAVFYSEVRILFPVIASKKTLVIAVKLTLFSKRSMAKKKMIDMTYFELSVTKKKT